MTSFNITIVIKNQQLITQYFDSHQRGQSKRKSYQYQNHKSQRMCNKQANKDFYDKIVIVLKC